MYMCVSGINILHIIYMHTIKINIILLMIYLTETWALALDTHNVQILTYSCRLPNHRHSSALLRPCFSRDIMFFHTASGLHQVVNSVLVNVFLYFSEISAVLALFSMTKTMKDCQLFKNVPQRHKVESVVGSPPVHFSSPSVWICRCSSPKMVLDPWWFSSEACTVQFCTAKIKSVFLCAYVFTCSAF